MHSHPKRLQLRYDGDTLCTELSEVFSEQQPERSYSLAGLSLSDSDGPLPVVAT